MVNKSTNYAKSQNIDSDSSNAAAANLAVIRALHLEITIKCFNYILLPRGSVVRIIYGNVNSAAY